MKKVVKFKKKKYILLFPKDCYGQDEAENVCGNTYDFDQYKRLFQREVQEYSLENFTKLLNTFDKKGSYLNDYWITFVNVYVMKNN